ncbi:MAG: filamentous hemagglutinin N-terminal domain-containing protein, partial [Sulfuritalea sp.]|nr:filamentous hemagglutinin N-terminal domain-containing protein [Sulfuritalea sp.]
MFKHATLNRAYRLVWSELRNTWIAVAEFARTRGKRASGAVAIGTALALGAANAMAAGEPSPTALPTNGQVVAGQVGISSSGARMDVAQGSNSAIVNWDSFNIGSQAHVNFAQPDASSVILNRASGGSAIFGRITANGNVFIVDPGGILFAPGAQVDVGGLVASSLGISDANFLAGKYQFERVGAGGTVVNQGRLTAANGGFVALIAPQVSNSGSITATAGSVGLAAGDSVHLDFDHDGLLSFQVDVAAAAARADNSGVIVADGGRVVMNAQAKDALLSTVLNNDGVIRARSLESRNGEIWLGGGSTGVVSVTGTLDASGTEAGQAGGTVKVLGDKVGLFAQAKVDVSGVGAGGTALVGGNWQGKGPEQNASATYVGKDVSIKADAVGTGDGGKVVVWSDQGTRFDGSISATGGAQGGDGGLVEVSGRDGLAFNGTVGAAAPMGKTGTLLLDPNDIYLIHGADTTGSEDANVTASAIDFAYVNIGNGEISDGKLDSLGDVNIILQAKNLIQVGTFAGASQAVSLTALTSNTLTLQSGDNTALGNINFVSGSSLTTAGGNVAMYAGVNPVGNVPYATDTGTANLGAITTNGGSLSVYAKGTLTAGGAIASNGGAVSLSSQDALAVDGGITAGAGTVSLLANQDGAGAQGFSQADATTIAGTGITLTVNTGAGTGTGGAVLSTLTDA